MVLMLEPFTGLIAKISNKLTTMAGLIRLESHAKNLAVTHAPFSEQKWSYKTKPGELLLPQTKLPKPGSRTQARKAVGRCARRP